uniref:Amidase domain-containing protein n=1 Tax=Globodera pallida TaxID=36090 RepID=A0A183C6S2_GLOPA
MANFFRTRHTIDKPTNELLLISAGEAATLIRKGEISSLQLVDAYIERIRHVNGALNAMVDENFTTARNMAMNIDNYLSILDKNSTEFANLVRAKPLLGVPFTVKDNTFCKGFVCTVGVSARKQNGLASQEDSEAVRRLKEAGAILLGITNVPELALWWETNNTIYGVTNNPYDLRRTPGGSSGGEGALLAAAGSVIGLGNDVGGSLRVPALFCGVFGLKPGPGVVQSTGILPRVHGGYMIQMATAGPMTRYASDLSLMLRVLAGEEIAESRLQLSRRVNFRNVRVFYMEDLKSLVSQGLSPEMRDSVRKTAKYFEKKYDICAHRLDLPLVHRAFEIFLASMNEEEHDNLGKAMSNFAYEVNCFAELVKYPFGWSDHTLPAIITGIRSKLPQQSDARRKFATLEYKTLTFDGLHIGVDELKKAICDKENIRTESFDLLLTNAHTKREYAVGELVPRNSSVVVQRIPRENALKLPKVQDTSTSGIISRNVSSSLFQQNSYIKPEEFAGMTEEQRLAHIKRVSTEKYNSSNYQRRTGGIMTGPPPATYVCNRCGQPGHWYKSCPLLNVRRTAGITMDELMETHRDDPLAMIHPSGKFVKPIMHHQARMQRKYEPFPGQPDESRSPGQSATTTAVPEQFRCRLCGGILRDAVLSACCGHSFCAECYQQQLLTHPTQLCPGADCVQQISADSLVPNKMLRDAVQKYLILGIGALEPATTMTASVGGTITTAAMTAQAGANKPNVLTDTHSLLHKLLPGLAAAQAQRELDTTATPSTVTTTALSSAPPVSGTTASVADELAAATSMQTTTAGTQGSGAFSAHPQQQIGVPPSSSGCATSSAPGGGNAVPLAMLFDPNKPPPSLTASMLASVAGGAATTDPTSRMHAGGGAGISSLYSGAVRTESPANAGDELFINMADKRRAERKDSVEAVVKEAAEFSTSSSRRRSESQSHDQKNGKGDAEEKEKKKSGKRERSHKRRHQSGGGTGTEATEDDERGGGGGKRRRKHKKEKKSKRKRKEKKE